MDSNNLFDPEAPLPRLRGDLVISEQEYRGIPSFIVKDPITLLYYRVGKEEIHLASLLNGENTLRQVVGLMNRMFAMSEHTEESVLQILMSFTQMSFLQLDGATASGFYRSLLERRRELKKKSYLHSIMGSIFYFKIPLYDPDILLIKMEKRVRFIWTKGALYCLAALLALSLYLLLGNWERMGHNLPDFFTLHNVGLLWLALFGVKVVHEFGHGLTCKHFGGEVHEMGSIFVVLTPFLYCDATDSWLFRQKWKKMAVNLGGIYFELFLAGFATLLWAATEPGVVNQLAINTMVVCSISTLVFNINPLLRFDGYYALADWVEVPNLRERARKNMSNAIVDFVIGETSPESQQDAEETLLWKIGITIFAIASYLYTWVVAYHIILLVGHKLEPYGLARLGQALEFLFYAATFLLPLRLFSLVLMERVKKAPHTIGRVKWIGAIAVVVLVLAGMFPHPVKVVTNCVIGGESVKPIRVGSAGFLRELRVKEGDLVTKGETLAVLENFPLETKLADIRAQLESNRILSSRALAAGEPSTLKDAEAQRKQLKATEEKLLVDIEALKIKAPMDGKILTSDLKFMLGTYYQEGTFLCELLPKDELQVTVTLNEREAGRVRAGQEVLMKMYAMPFNTFKGKVLSTSVANSEELPNSAFASHSVGDVPTHPDAQGRERPSTIVYQAELSIGNRDQSLRPGISGRAKILCGRATSWHIITSRLRELFRLDLQF